MRLILLISVVFGLLWGGGLLWFVAQIPRESPVNIEKTNAIVVLTGGSDRLREALFMLEKDYAQNLFVSGAGEGVTISDLFHNADYPRDNFNALYHKIDIGYRAQNTFGNALEIANWVEDNGHKSLRLVTSNYHMIRSYLELRHLMPNVTIIQHPVIPEQVLLDRWWQHEGTKKLIVNEYNKLVGAMLHRQLRNRIVF